MGFVERKKKKSNVSKLSLKPKILKLKMIILNLKLKNGLKFAADVNFRNNHNL